MKYKASRALGILGAASIALIASATYAQTKILVWTDTARIATFEAYDAAHPDVELELLTVANTELVTKLQLAMRAGADVPDVIFMSSTNHQAQLSTRRTNYLMDLRDKVPQELLDGFLPGANSVCEVNGKIVCLRNDVAHFVLWYDKPLMDELGLKVPETWEEYEQMGADLVAMGKGYFMGAGAQPDFDIGILASAGCDIATPVEGKEDTLRIDLSSEGCLRAANMIDRMIANGSLLKFGMSEPGLVTQAVDGKLVLSLGPTWFAEYIMKTNYQIPPGHLSAALPPRWADQEQPITWSQGGGTFGAWKDTKHPDIAVDIVTWSTTEESHLENAVTMPAFEAASVLWGKRVNSDPYYATNDVYDTMLAAAPFSAASYVSLGFDMRVAFGKVVSASLSTDGKLVDLLPAFQEELTNVAKVAGYTVE